MSSYRGGSGGGRGRYGGGRGSGGGSGGGGRGEYYRNKYGGGGRGGGGRGRGRGGIQEEHGSLSTATTTTRSGTYDDLQRLLQHIDGQSYGAYHDLETSEQGGGGWYNATRGFTLLVGRAQSDPFAPPTSCQLVLPAATMNQQQQQQQHLFWTSTLYANPVRRLASADYLWRRVYHTCRDMGADQTLRHAEGASTATTTTTTSTSWSGPKGGDVQIMEPTPHVLEQSAVTVQADGTVRLQLSINLPARGRTILGRAAHQILVHVLDRLVQAIVQSVAHKEKQEDTKTFILRHVDCIEDQLWLQQQLPAAGLVAFVANGAILPRFAGNDDRPMPSHKHPIPFVSPTSLETSFVLPNAQTTITGMGIPTGITLLCGGGFHGKSTLLQALQYGIYAKCPGDGREFCMTSPRAVKIRAEDGRNVQHVDISSFVKHLPLATNPQATQQFSTTDASGSTSQASNIVESRKPLAQAALELGADTLLIDEDTCATNFMIRDAKMVQLVAADKEPITPFVRVAPSLFRDYKVSVILVIGGAGDYFEIADRVLLMDCYKCVDATERARQIVALGGSGGIMEPPAPFGPLRERCPDTTKFIPNGKVKTSAKGMVSYGETELDFRALEQIVSIAQTRAIALSLQTFSSIQVNVTPHPTLRALLQELDKRIDQEGLDSVLAPGQFNGALTRPRLFEIGAAANRLRRDGAIVQK